MNENLCANLPKPPKHGDVSAINLKIVPRTVERQRVIGIPQPKNSFIHFVGKFAENFLLNIVAHSASMAAEKRLLE